MKNIKYKFLLYKHHNVDIWGDFKNNLRRTKRFFYNWKFKSPKLKLNLWSEFPYSSKFINKINFYFINKFLMFLEKKWKQAVRFTYLLKDFQLRIKKKRKYKHLDTLRLTLLFYVNLKQKQFCNMARKAKKMNGFFEENFLFLLEGRIMCIVYRSGLILNMFDAISFVKNGFVKVNGVYISNINYIVPIMKIIGFRNICKGFLFLTFWKKIIRRIVFRYPPKFFFFFYKFFFFFLKRNLRKKDFANPFRLDMYRATGYGGFAK